MLVLLLVMLVVVAEKTECPHYCECMWRSGKEAVACNKSGLTIIPTKLPVTTQLLDLSENKLTALRDDMFVNAGLINLQRLYLGSCNIRIIKQHAFKNLINLVELDLSKNRLEVIPSQAFYDIPELRELRLQNNIITRIKDEAFTALKNLVRLNLNKNKITELELRAFVGLEGTLEYLRLDENRLRTIHAGVLAPLRQLKGVELALNLWDCSCSLRPIRELLLVRNIPTTIMPECTYPSRLKSKTWNRIHLEEFACKPDIQPASKEHVGTEGEDITLICKVSGIPAPRTRWLRSGRLLANSTSSHHTNSGKLFVMRSGNQTSNLTIKSADIHDSGSYSCTAENKAGKSEAIVTVVIKKRQFNGGFNGRGLIAGVAVSAVIVLSLCLVALFLYETRKNQQLDSRNEQIVTINRRTESYEKIEMNVNKLDAEQTQRSLIQNDNGRKRGDYHNIPLNDPEDECDNLPPRHLIAEKEFDLREPTWQRAEINPPHTAWSRRPELDLHIPQFSDYDLRINSTPDAISSTTSHGILSCRMNRPHIDNRILDKHTKLSNNMFCNEPYESNILNNENEKNYPDIIEMSALGASILKNEKRREQYFCTVPRKKYTDSRSPLLGSRRNSSGGDSYSSYEMRMKNAGRRSNSFLDLSSDTSRTLRNPSLPTTPTRHRSAVPSATPLLDLSGFRDYSRMDQTLDDYDFRASQLEGFLEEYRNLRVQLSKVKETRESIQRHRNVENDEIRSLMKSKTSIAVTETSSLAAIPDAASPLTLTSEQQPRPEWMSSLKFHN